ncbi:MAG: hypothetical protein F6K19_08650 [Cyanothece sp. SIO1E1]|nr:hypothetical protein [Cyanothece sp. SIO1E1]
MGEGRRSPLKPGAPFPRVRLPENFVARPDALNAVKAKLLAEDERTLVVSAISGLGGLGKSVLAMALVLDPEVQARFADGILWVTLGQNPDLQTMLGDWIRELDKSREAFSANTLEAASRYLHNLLAERRMLLVVDDVWNAAHAEWFRVGGVGCRVLVTTREAQIEGAEYYPLDLMSEAEAVELVRQKLEQQWNVAQAAEVKAFAKVLGHLPLALDLATNQVRDGFTWAELRSEFEAERRAVALEVLDASEAFEYLPLEEQRKYSLQACFNLSLLRLQEKKPKLLQQFAWLGVLPEDVNLNVQVAAVLWNVRPLMAKKALIDLRQRSFLTDGVATFAGEPTYRVHDLMHDMARNLIENGTLSLPTSPLSLSPLAQAHREFLGRYRARATEHRWDGLPHDGYIHRHLTWHMEQANWVDEIHALMAMSDAQGRNAWFEACDRIGQPAIFVKDVARGWALAEQGYELGATRSIVLQCRYAIITATLNSLVANLPIGMMAEFVKRGFWTIEQAWAYVEQVQNEERLAEAIQALAPYLSESLFQVALTATRAIQDESKQANTLSQLAKIDGAHFAEALAAAQVIQDESSRADIICQLATINGVDFSTLLTAAQAIQDESNRANVLCQLAKINRAYFPEALAATKAMQNQDWRAFALSQLAKIDGAYFAEALAAARAMQNQDWRVEILGQLATINEAYFAEALAAAEAIQDKLWRASILGELTTIDEVYFAEAFTEAFADALLAARAIQDESSRADVLKQLAKINGADFSALLAAAEAIQDEFRRASILRQLATIDEANFPALLAAVRAMQNESDRAIVLSEMAKINGVYFAEALAAAQAIQIEFSTSRVPVLSQLAQSDNADFSALLVVARAMKTEYGWARVWSQLAKMDQAYFAEALAAAQAVQDENLQSSILSQLATIDGADFSVLLAAAQVIQHEFFRAMVLRELAKIDGADFSALLAATRAIQDEFSRASVLRDLAEIDRTYFAEALAAARAIQNETYRASVLGQLAAIDGADFSALLIAVRTIQDELGRASILRQLATIDGAYFIEALAAAQAIQDESNKVSILGQLATIDGADFPILLVAVQAIQDEFSQAKVLSQLATVDRAHFAEAVVAAQAIQDKASRAYALSRLATIDGAYFAEALAATQAVQDETSRASVLSQLATIDGADFSALLIAVRMIQDESSQARVLSQLAKIDGADFSALLAATQAIQNESNRADVLHDLIQHAPQDFLSILWDEIFALTHKPTGAKALSDSLPYLPLTTLSHADWQSSLHLLAYRQRSDLMQDLVTLYPAILHLGGEAAMHGVVETMHEVCNQWK